jgi:hypothetical protein
MAINRGPWNALVDDDGTNLVGSVWNKAQINTVLLDPIDALVSGRIDVPYSAANFGAEQGVWTVEAGDQLTYSYTRVDKLVILSIYVVGTDLTGAQTQVFRIYLPAGMTIAKTQKGYLAYYGTTSGTAVGVTELNAGQNYLRLMRDIAGTFWPIGGNYALGVNMSFWIE